MEEPWGMKAARIAIAIGKDADRDVLQQFIGHSEFKPLDANNPDALKKMIKWASTTAIKTASAPPSTPKEQVIAGNIPIPQPPPKDINEKDVW